MSIKLHISPRIIPSIASLYNDVNRIFMEYIDNSLDSAESLFDSENNSYRRPIEVILTIEGEKHSAGKVTILDNCLGIANMIKVVKDIGNSDKKAQPWTNGQFGYGVYSFMASCSKLEIRTKLSTEKALYMPINREQFDTDSVDDVMFPDPKIMKSFEHDAGTEIRLSNFNKDDWKQIDIAELKNEIEKHFELLLARKNLTIKLISKTKCNIDKFVCKPFDYTLYDGEVWTDSVSKLSYMTRGRSPKPVSLIPSKPIQIFIKITKGKEINKRPVFIRKGRRIGEIKDISKFRSKLKSQLWDHPNVTGYIDLSDFLEPTIARNDFESSNHVRALFNYLYDIEPVILEVVTDVNKRSEDRHYQELEDRLNKALSKLARIDAMNYRTDYLSGGAVNLVGGATGQSLEDDLGSKDRGDEGNIGKDGQIGENEGAGKGAGGGPGEIPGGELGGDAALNKEADNPYEDSGFKGGEKRKSGFNIRIDEKEPDIDTITNKPIRSRLIGSEIRIYRQHPDFLERVKVKRRGAMEITPRLITYLAGEITVHYKDKLYTRKGTQPEYNIKLFEDLVGFVYQFENMLKDLAGKNLSHIS